MATAVFSRGKRRPKRRSRLVASSTEAMLRRRAMQGLGGVMALLALATGAMLSSHTPADPSFFVSTTAPAQNALGLAGAYVSDLMLRVLGAAAWGLPLALAVWGGRLAMGVSGLWVLTRVVFVPLVLALAAIFAATHAPGASWPHDSGLGGILGDVVLESLLPLVAPANPGGMLKVLSLLLGLMLIPAGGYVLGMNRAEARSLLVWLWQGAVFGLGGLTMALAWIAQRGLRLLGRGAHGLRSRVELRIDARREAAAVARSSAEQRVAERLDALRADPVHGATHADPHEQARLPRPTAIVRPDPGQHQAQPTGQVSAPELRPEPPMHPEPPLAARLGAHAAPRGTPVLGGVRRDNPTPQVLHPGLDPAPAERADPVLTRAPAPPAPASGPESEPEQDLFDDEIIDDFDYIGPEDIGPDDAAATHATHAATAPLPAPVAAAAYQAVPETKHPEPPHPGPLPLVRQPERKARPSTRARAEAQPMLLLEDGEAPAYEPPPLSLLTSPKQIIRQALSNDALEQNARMLETVLDDYGIKGEIVTVRPGPVVTLYELEPAAGIKASRVIGLADDIARSMSALAARVSTIPGRTVIGIELPNAHREQVLLRELLESRAYGDSRHALPLALGKDIGGEPEVVNLARMPHLLIAGTTGSGKSVAINTMILSLLYARSPAECRLIMIDPKMLELSVYDGIPHLLSPVVTDPKKAVVALKWAVAEMEERYRKMSRLGVRNIDGYNGRVAEALAKGKGFSRTVQTGFDDDTGEPIFETETYEPEKMPYIVVVVDEMADLMMVAGKEIEACIQRLAQMARAAGIHLIMATQRPSVDVITGTIKANFPTRISFQVTSKIDSRTILGEMGAEQLLGRGDMLFMAGGGRIHRVHGPFASDEEVEEVVRYLKSLGEPEYVSGVLDGPDGDSEAQIDEVLGLGNGNSEDQLYDQAVAIAIRDRKCSTSYIQRKLAIGYNKAARLVERMETEGVISGADSVGRREVLVPER